MFSGTQTHLKMSKKGFIFHTHSALFCIQIEEINPKSTKSKVFSFDFTPFTKKYEVNRFTSSTFSKIMYFQFKDVSLGNESTLDGMCKRLRWHVKAVRNCMDSVWWWVVYYTRKGILLKMNANFIPYWVQYHIESKLEQLMEKWLHNNKVVSCRYRQEMLYLHL